MGKPEPIAKQDAPTASAPKNEPIQPS
jgi:hypothetical protein